MKNIFLVLFIVIIFSASTKAEIKKVEVNQYGEIRLDSLGLNWRQLNSQELEAYRNPGNLIPVKIIKKEYVRVNFFFYKIRQSYDQFVVYDGKKLMTKNQSDVVTESENKFAWHVLFLLIGIISTIFSNLSNLLNKYNNWNTKFNNWNTRFNVLSFFTSFVAHVVIADMKTSNTIIVVLTTGTASLISLITMVMYTPKTRYISNKAAYKTFMLMFYVVATTSLIMNL